jgi:DNA-3-methyladenine glycosylase II
MRRLIQTHGPCTLVPKEQRSPFESLVRAVANQQLNGTAAQTILGRFQGLFPRSRFPSAKQIAKVTDDEMRVCGFSWAKIAAIRDIAAKTLDGTVPGPKKISDLPDDEIIERLVQVRGVGRWTVEMLLIFQLGRPDVLPADDFGVRNGFRLAFRLDEMPKPKEVLAYGDRWRPYATTAAWYLWRAADAPKERKAIKGVNA